MIGRWSDERAVTVCQVVRFAMLCCVMVMSGEEDCWLFAVGKRVGLLVLIVV